MKVSRAWDIHGTGDRLDWNAIKSQIDLAAITTALLGPAPGRRGEKSRRLWWKCPLHEDRNPSFRVEPGRRWWKCFGCGEKGDAPRLDVCFISSRPQPPGVVYRVVVDRGVVQTAVTSDQTRLSRVVACDGSRQKGFPAPAVPPCRSNGRDERGVNCGDRGIARSQHRTLPLNRNLHVVAIGATRY